MEIIMINRSLRFFLSIILLFFFSDCVHINAMEEKPEKARAQAVPLPVCDRSFFGLDESVSKDQYLECVRIFLYALDVQHRLVRITDEMIRLEVRIKNVERERYEYYRVHFQHMLQKPALDPIDMIRIIQFLKYFSLVCNFTHTVPIIGTTTRAIASILMLRDLIQATDVPRGKLRLISHLTHSDDDEIRFIGKYLHYKASIDNKNRKWDDLDKRACELVKTMRGYLGQLKNFSQEYISKVMYAGRELIELKDKIEHFSSCMHNIALLTKEALDRMDYQTRCNQRKIVDTYMQRAAEIDQLRSHLIKLLHSIEKKTSVRVARSCERKEKEKRT